MERGVSSRRRGRPTGSMGGGSRRQNYDSSPSFSSATAINTSALQNLVGRVLREEGGPQADAYSRKTTAASQLASLFSAMSQDELVSGLDVVFQTKPNGRPGLESAFEDPRATLAFRQMVSRAIISFGTAIKGDPRFFLRWLFAQVGGLGGQVVSPNEKDKDVRLALLGCLREIVDQLSQNSAINFGRYVDSILDDLQSVLDGPNAPECLPKILDVFHLIADRYPSKFSVHFPDIIDLLVGWSVDLVLTKATSSLIAESIKKLWVFWKDHISFALQIVLHLLTDVEKVAEIQCRGNVLMLYNQSGVDDQLYIQKSVGGRKKVHTSIYIHLRCLHAIIYSICFSSMKSINPDASNSLESTFFDDFEFEGIQFNSALQVLSYVVHWSLLIYRTLLGQYQDSTLETQIILQITFLSKAFEKHYWPFQTQTFALLIDQLDSLFGEEEELPGDFSITEGAEEAEIDLKPSRKSRRERNKRSRDVSESDASENLCEWLNTTRNIVSLWNGVVHSSLVEIFLSPSRFRLLRDVRIKFALNVKVNELLKSLYEDMFRDIIPETDNSKKPELFLEFLSILQFMNRGSHDGREMLDFEQSPNWNIVDIFQDHPDSNMLFSAILFTDAQLLAVLASPQASGVNSHEIAQILVDFVSRDEQGHLPKIHDNSGDMKILKSVLTIAKKCDMFLSKNDILGHDILNSVLVYLASWLTENTAERVLTLCRQAMTLTWIYHAVKQFKLLNIKGVDERTVQIVDKLICSYLWHPDIEPDFLVQIVCVAGMHVTLYEQSCLYKCENLKRIITSFHHVNRKVRDAFINLYGKLNPILTLSVSHFTDRSTDTVKFEMYSSPYTGAFREKQFMLAMDCLGIMPLSTPTDNAFEGSEELFSNKVLEFMSNPSQMLDQLERLYHACQLNQCFELFSQTEGNELSDDVLFKWASWECSRYCTLSRLRTPFGGPVQTLETIEWSLSSWMAVMDSLENSIEEDIEEKRVQLKVKACVSKILQNHLLFIDHLEVQIKYTADGGALSNHFAVPPRPCIVFFNSNRSVCEEWLTNIRSKAFECCDKWLRFGSEEYLLRHGLENHSLSMQTMNENMEHLLMQTYKLTLGLVWVEDNDNIMGMRDAISSLKINNDESDKVVQNCQCILFGLSKFAERSYEDASVALKSGLDNLDDVADCDLIRLIKCLLTQCHIHTHNWQSLYGYTNTQALQQMTHLSENDLWSHLTSWCEFGQQNFVGAEESLQDVWKFKTPYKIGYVGDSLLISELHLLKVMSIISTLIDYSGDATESSPVSFVSNIPADAINRGSILLEEGVKILTPILESIQSNYTLSYNGTALLQLQINQLLQAFLTGQRQHGLSNISDHQFNADRVVSNDRLQLWSKFYNILDTFQFVQTYSTLETSTSISDIIDAKLIVAQAASDRECQQFAQYIVDDIESVLSERTVMTEKNFNQLFEISKIKFKIRDKHSATQTLLSLLQKCNVSKISANAWCRLSKWTSDVDSRNTISPLLSTYLGTLDTDQSTEGYLDTDQSTEGYPDLLLKYAMAQERTPNIWFYYANFHYEKSCMLLDQWNVENHFNPITKVWTEHFGDVTEANIDIEAIEAKKRLSKIVINVLQVYDENILDHVSELVEKAFPSVDTIKRKQLTESIRTFIETTYTNFSCAVEGYCNFLLDSCDSGDLKSIKKETKAALRLWKLLSQKIRFSISLPPDVLTSLPSRIWESLLPQIFAQLKQRKQGISNIVVQQILSLSIQNPHSVVYPAVIALLDSKDEPPEVVQVLQQIIENIKMSIGTSEPVEEVQSTIVELRRLAVLWDEEWFHKLGKLQNTSTQLDNFGKESKNIQQSTILSKQDQEVHIATMYGAVINPVVQILEILLNKTSPENAATIHEKRFISKYYMQIKTALNEIKNPKSWDEARVGWIKFKEVYKELSRDLNQPRTLKLADLSMVLSQMSGSFVPIPGQKKSLVLLESIGKLIRALPTKTKPKKIVFLGNDGKDYTYLLKGLESQYLDERIMQFLSTLNIFLRLDQHAASRNLLSQTYSVIPLGEKVGMIEWVQNMTELFSIYRKWQQQEQTLEQLKQNVSETKDPNLSVIPRPHDQFYGKIIKALKHHGLSLTLQRKHWPIRMLCDVFNELSSQVPADLFSRALWMTAVDSPVWWRNVTEYTRSLAVMSIAGYILGLGDRHLDNIMVNLQTGTILHIDYNVCFDKGTQLKIPETVPFRLTRNLEHAMGPLAKMGSFRISSENVLDVMRKRSDELLLLLEDSLSTPSETVVDSIDEDEMFHANFNIHLSFLAAKIATLKPLMEVEMKTSSQLLQILQLKLNAYIKQKQKLVSFNPEELSTLNLEIEKIRNILSSKANECESWEKEHASAFEQLKGQNLIQSLVEVQQINPQFIYPPLNPMLYELQVGSQLTELCIHLDQSFMSFANEQVLVLSSILELLRNLQIIVGPAIISINGRDKFKVCAETIHYAVNVPIIQIQQYADLLTSKLEYSDNPTQEIINLEKSIYEMYSEKFSNFVALKSCATNFDNLIQTDSKYENKTIQWVSGTADGDEVIQELHLACLRWTVILLRYFEEEERSSEISVLFDDLNSCFTLSHFKHVLGSILLGSSMIQNVERLLKIVNEKHSEDPQFRRSSQMLLILSHIVSIVQQIYDSVISTAVGSSLALLSMNPELVNTLSESISTLKDNNDRDRNSSEKLQENINWFNNMLETFESSNNLLHSHTLLHILEDIFSQVEGLCRQLDLQKENLETLHKFLMMSKVKFAETVLESFLVVLDTVNNSSTLSSPFFDLAWRKSSQYSDFKALFQSFVAEFCKLLIEPVFVQAMQIFGQYHLSALKVDRSDSPLSIILSTADVHSLKHHFKAAEKKLSESAQSERKSHETMQILFKPFSISIRDWIQTKLRERLHFADEDVAQWKFTLLQFQYVHFDALVHKSECLENMAAPFRSQLVENIQGFMSQLESLKMNMTSLEKSNSSFKQTLVSMHSAEANNVSVSNIQIVRILELADVRQLHLQRDKQRNQYILDILNAFNHFELSRIPDSPLNMIFTDIIVLIRQLSALESDRQQLILRATSNTSKSTEVTKDGEIDAMTATLGEHLQRFKGYKSQLEKYIQNVASCAQATSQSKHISAEVTNFRQLCSTLDSIVTNVSKITPEKIDATPELLQNIVKSIISFTAPELKRNKLLSQAQEDITSEDKQSTAEKVYKKIHGMMTSPSKTLSVSEEVDYLIKEATKITNLAVMYEGWMGWI